MKNVLATLMIAGLIATTSAMANDHAAPAADAHAAAPAADAHAAPAHGKKAKKAAHKKDAHAAPAADAHGEKKAE